jgi:hypothetical protein
VVTGIDYTTKTNEFPQRGSTYQQFSLWFCAVRKIAPISGSWKWGQGLRAWQMDDVDINNGSFAGISLSDGERRHTKV